MCALLITLYLLMLWHQRRRSTAYEN